MPDINLENIVKNYGTGKNAVNKLSITIEDGDFMCLLGPSGCGKSTTVRMIAGLENITEGYLTIGSTVVDAPDDARFVPAEKRDIGLVFQSYALWPHLTVQDNITYGLKLRKKSKSDREEVVRKVSEKLSIGQYLDRYPSQLSGGQQQRVALARMLAVNPRLMLLDEPLSNLDSRLRLEMRAELKRIHAEFGATIVFVTHDQWEAMTLATRVAVMYEGELQQVGTPMDIYDRPANKFVANFLGVPPINFIDMNKGSSAEDAPLEYLSSRMKDTSVVGSVGIRPESIDIEYVEQQSVNDAFRLFGRVESIMPTGGSWTVETIVGDQRIYSTKLNRGDLSIGDDIVLVTPAERIHVFDTNDLRVELGS